MPGTRSQDKQLEEFVDNPEDIARKKKTKMTEPARNNQGPTGGPTEPTEETEETTTTPEPTLYLPDMENTTLKDARKRAIQWGPNTDEYLVECPGIETFYGDSTVLVDFTDGSCQLFMGGELEHFPLQASESPFPLTLLAKILKSDTKQRISTSDIPGNGLTTVISEPMTWDAVGCRTEIFAELVGMYAANQISLQHAQLLPKDMSYREISRYETKSRRLETRMDELLAVFTHDNYLREEAGLRKYPLPKVIPINKAITTKIQAGKYFSEAQREAKAIAKAAFNDKGEPFKATDNILEPTAATATDRQSDYTTALPPANRGDVATTATSRPDRD